jgi:hypothetical protein
MIFFRPGQNDKVLIQLDKMSFHKCKHAHHDIGVK